MVELDNLSEGHRGYGMWRDKNRAWLLKSAGVSPVLLALIEGENKTRELSFLSSPLSSVAWDGLPRGRTLPWWNMRSWAHILSSSRTPYLSPSWGVFRVHLHMRLRHACCPVDWSEQRRCFATRVRTRLHRWPRRTRMGADESMGWL